MVNNNGLQIPATRLSIDYPPVMVNTPNGNYGRQMLDNFAGRNSEMSAFGGFLYYYYMLMKDYPEIAAVFKEIYQVELLHMEIFGELAYLLGMDPRMWSYANSRIQYWSPSYIIYQHTLQNILETAIYREELILEKYQGQLNRMEDPYISAVMERIILDEEHHLALLNVIYQQYFG